MFLQLWRVGRQSHTDLQPGGKAPVAPSAIRADGQAYSVNGEAALSMPRALALREIPAVIEAFRASAARALGAGFAGVELHGPRSEERRVGKEFFRTCRSRWSP